MHNTKVMYIIGYTYGFEKIVPDYGYTPITDKTIKSYDGPIDIVAWMGGTDINPKLYNQRPIMSTQRPDNARDMREIGLHAKYKHLPKLGICRGAQLLCVLNGGSLYQDIDRHGYNHHLINDIHGRTVISSSVHHQQMILPDSAQLVAWTDPLSTYRANDQGIFDNDYPDPEIAWIPDDQALLIQGHPEFGPPEFEQYSMQLVDEYIWSQNSVNTIAA